MHVPLKAWGVIVRTIVANRKIYGVYTSGGFPETASDD